MRNYSWLAAALIMLLVIPTAFAAKTRWGANYFPNIPLTTQDGKSVKFFDDLIKDKIVVINFIYTTCPDSCPLETAQLVRVQLILGERLNKDVFFYSITIDPETDTIEELSKYREKFDAKWTFLTGKESDIIQLRRKLGLYVEEIQDGSNNHNVSMIIGNQTTGQWMKRSPFENPYVLADQLGNWLSGWKSPPKNVSYTEAPELRNISLGERLFRTRCATCHTITGNEMTNALGPDLLGVTQRREMSWLLNWLRAPDQMLTDKDPIAMALYEQYNQLAMPNMRLNEEDGKNLITYLEEETARLEKKPIFPAAKPLNKVSRESKAETQADVVAIMNAWVRESMTPAPINAGYMTLINVGDTEEILIGIESPAFKKVEIHEMSMHGGMMKMQQIHELVIGANGQVKLAPNGRHLMMKERLADLEVGQIVEMTLLFKSGKKQTISLKVEAR